jgi:HSP20 family molecular chaperone IbpA
MYIFHKSNQQKIEDILNPKILEEKFKINNINEILEQVYKKFNENNSDILETKDRFIYKFKNIVIPKKVMNIVFSKEDFINLINNKKVYKQGIKSKEKIFNGYFFLDNNNKLKIKLKKDVVEENKNNNEINDINDFLMQIFFNKEENKETNLNKNNENQENELPENEYKNNSFIEKTIEKNIIIKDFLKKFENKGEQMLQTNVFKTNEEMIYEICVPGARNEDLEVNLLSDRTLNIKYNKFNPYQHIEDTNKKLEYEYKTYERNITLKEDLNEEEIKIECSNGMLIIKIPFKKIEEKTSKKIDIKFI